MCVRARVCERERERACVCERERERACVCERERERACVCERARARVSCVGLSVWMPLWVCVCVMSVCVCAPGGR